MTELDRLAALKTAWPSVTPTEGMVFIALWDAKGRVITATHIADYVRDVRGDYPGTEVIRTCVKRLRRILRAHEVPAGLITARGIGYQLKQQGDWSWETPSDTK